jgi:xylan 1,4-beta-xylosidase
MMSFWTFSDVFEEDGPKREPFDGGFGLLAMGGIKKPSYAAFSLLHQLGQERIPLDAPDILVTRRADHTRAIAAWKLVDPDKKGNTRRIKLKISGVRPNAAVAITRVDADHANTLATYQNMGHPRNPTEAQVRELNAVADPNPPQNVQLHDGQLDLQIPIDGLVLLIVSTGK